MAAAFETEPLLVQRLNFSPQYGGGPEHGNVDALNFRNSASETSQNSPFQVMALGDIARGELIRDELLRSRDWII